MDKKLLKDSLVWGFILWFFGYLLGIILFFILPSKYIGWAILPFGTLVTLYVLFKKILSLSLRYHLLLGIIWVIIAVALDYLFIVKLFNPTDGYYKLDVYLYYFLTFLLPVIAGLKKRIKKE